MALRRSSTRLWREVQGNCSFAKAFQFSPVCRRGCGWRSTISGPLSACAARRGRWRNALRAEHCTAGNAPSWGTKKQGTAPHRRSLWRCLAKPIKIGLRLIIQAQARATAVCCWRAGDDVIYLALHQSLTRRVTLCRRSGTLAMLLASAAAPMGAARRLALRAVGQSAFHLGAGVLFLSSHLRHLGPLVGSTPLTVTAPSEWRATP